MNHSPPDPRDAQRDDEDAKGKWQVQHGNDLTKAASAACVHLTRIVPGKIGARDTKCQKDSCCTRLTHEKDEQAVKELESRKTLQNRNHKQEDQSQSHRREICHQELCQDQLPGAHGRDLQDPVAATFL